MHYRSDMSALLNIVQVEDLEQAVNNHFRVQCWFHRDHKKNPNPGYFSPSLPPFTPGLIQAFDSSMGLWVLKKKHTYKKIDQGSRYLQNDIILLICLNSWGYLSTK